LVAEAELGERIMRALILRRVGLLQSGVGGPLIIGHSGDGNVLRLAGFLARNGHPHHTLDPDSDSCAKTLLERFSVEPTTLPIVLCPNGRMLRNPSEVELARCIGLVRPIDPSNVYDVAIIGAGPAGLAAAVYAASEGLSVIVLDRRAFGGQAGRLSREPGGQGLASRARTEPGCEHVALSRRPPRGAAEHRGVGADGSHRPRRTRRHARNRPLAPSAVRRADAAPDPPPVP